jgi:hypothetical protein
VSEQQRIVRSRGADVSTHGVFDYLCALSAANELSRDEQATLKAHLQECSKCSDALQQYESIVLESNAQGAEFRSAALTPSTSGFVDEAINQATKGRLLERVQEIDSAHGNEHSERHVDLFALVSAAPSRAGWAMAACLILVALSLAFYHQRPGTTRVVSAGTPPAAPSQSNELIRQVDTLRQELAQERNQRELLNTSQSKAESVIENLRTERAQLLAQIGADESARDRSAADLSSLQDRVRSLQSALDAAQGMSSRIQSENGELSQKATGLETELQQARTELALATARNQEVEHTSLQQVRYAERQRKLLATDRDLREMLGARSLRIIDVYDVGSKGEYQQPFGRIFYTQGKYLIFYAFDLDKQKGLKPGTSFQAWGEKGGAQDAPHRLGSFYMEDPGQNRWVLKVDDTRLLSRIDYIFVTDNSPKDAGRPQGRVLLSASLNSDVNHP